MTQGSDQAGAGGSRDASSSSSWPGGSAAGPPPPSAGGALTVGGILTVAGILLLFVAFALGLASLQYCFNALDRHGRRRGRRGGTVAGGGATGGGVDPELLRSLPVTVYRAAPGPKAAAEVECAVCLAELEDGEEARFLPGCGHGFHAECVDTWLASHSTCPLCRLTVAKPDVPPAPALPLALPPAPPEPANYAASLPASVLLGLPDHSAASAVAPSTDDRGTAAALVIEIPAESAVRTPRGAAKSPGSARLRSIRKLWSFGTQGAGPSSSCTCGAGDGAGDVEQGNGVAVADAPLPSDAVAGATRGAVL